jgi:DNA repair REX1-B
MIAVKMINSQILPIEYILAGFYFRGLEQILSSGNLEHYPLICADVTATFTVLSSTINAIRSNLESRRMSQQPIVNEILLLIHRLQRAEQTKLHLTAALHLERIRRKTQPQSHRDDDDANIDYNVPAPVLETALAESNRTITTLLEESIETLRTKILLTAEEINDVLEELRYAAIDNED